MKTRIFFLTMIFTLAASFTFAQGTSFGIIGGASMQNLNGKNIVGDKLENDMIIGYHVGVNAQIPIAPQFYFQPGLLFSTKGGEDTKGLITSKTNLSYIELPLNFVYKAELGSGYFMLGFGPYVAYAIGGKVTYGPVTVTKDIEFKNTVEIGDPTITTPYFKPLDAGANIFFGYELAMGAFIQFDAQLGLININPEYKILPDSKEVIKNTGFGLSLGYRF